MNRKIKDTEYNDSIAFWQQLAEKYFEAETTRKEESALRRFLATEESNIPQFNEIKAVLGYAATARHFAEKGKRRKRMAFGSIARYISVAAAIAIAVIIGITATTGTAGKESTTNSDSGEDVYIAYINGVCYTDKDFVMEQMHKSIACVSGNTAGYTIEDELGKMFRSAELE